MSKHSEILSLIEAALSESRCHIAHHEVEFGDPPTHVFNRNMDMAITHLEYALFRARVATGQEGAL